MAAKNIAYTKEYQLTRDKVEYLFQDCFLDSSENRTIANGKFRLNIKTYTEKTASRIMGAQFISVYNKNEELLFEQKCTYDKGFFRYIAHENGEEYLLFSIDLYGYSILNLNSLTVFHYIPEEAETFIWTDADYSGSNKIAALGCFWACDYEFEIYGFSNPEKLPYKQLVRHEDLEPQYNHWLEPIGWVLPTEYAYYETAGKEKTYKTVNVFSIVNHESPKKEAK